MLKLAIEFVNQLILERENLLNYAARMMKNNITELLLRGEEGYGSYDGGETAEKVTRMLFMQIQILKTMTNGVTAKSNYRGICSASMTVN